MSVGEASFLASLKRRRGWGRNSKILCISTLVSSWSTGLSSGSRGVTVRSSNWLGLAEAEMRS